MNPIPSSKPEDLQKEFGALDAWTVEQFAMLLCGVHPNAGPPGVDLAKQPQDDSAEERAKISEFASRKRHALDAIRSAMRVYTLKAVQKTDPREEDYVRRDEAVKWAEGRRSSFPSFPRFPVGAIANKWPWGDYETPALALLAKVGMEFFAPGKPRPQNKAVSQRILELGVVKGEREADTLAQVLCGTGKVKP